MKIGPVDTNIQPVAAANGAAAAATAGKPAAPAAAPEASTQVALSPAATKLVSESNADFDTEKVSRIAQAIRDGQFKVNAEAIADKMLTQSQEFLASQKH